MSANGAPPRVLPTLSEGQIDRIASMQAKHAGERSRLESKQENEGRQLMAQHQRERQQLEREINAELGATVAAAAPVIPVASTPAARDAAPPSPRRNGPRR